MIFFRRTVIITEAGISIWPLLIGAGIVFLMVRYGDSIGVAFTDMLIIIAWILGTIIGSMIIAGLSVIGYKVGKYYHVDERIIEYVRARNRVLQETDTRAIQPTAVISAAEYNELYGGEKLRANSAYGKGYKAETGSRIRHT